MGMPGSETALEELMCRVLGDLFLEAAGVCREDLNIPSSSDVTLPNSWGRG